MQRLDDSTNQGTCAQISELRRAFSVPTLATASVFFLLNQQSFSVYLITRPEGLMFKSIIQIFAQDRINRCAKNSNDLFLLNLDVTRSAAIFLDFASLGRRTLDISGPGDPSLNTFGC